MNSIQHKLYILNNCYKCFGYCERAANKIDLCKVFGQYYEITKRHTRYCKSMNYKDFVRDNI